MDGDRDDVAGKGSDRVIVVHEMVVAGVVWGVGDWLIKVPGRVLQFIQ